MSIDKPIRWWLALFLGGGMAELTSLHCQWPAPPLEYARVSFDSFWTYALLVGFFWAFVWGGGSLAALLLFQKAVAVFRGNPAGGAPDSTTGGPPSKPAVRKTRAWITLVACGFVGHFVAAWIQWRVAPGDTLDIIYDSFWSFLWASQSRCLLEWFVPFSLQAALLIAWWSRQSRGLPRGSR